MLMAALAPAVSRALAAADGGWTAQDEICSVTAPTQSENGSAAQGGMLSGAQAGHAAQAARAGHGGHAAHGEYGLAQAQMAQTIGSHNSLDSHESHAGSHAKPGMHMDHCGYCYLDGHSPASLQVPVVYLAGEAAHSLAPRLFLQSPYPLHVWAAAQPRAPPAILS